MSQIHCELHYRCLVIITIREFLIGEYYPEIPDEEITEGGGGRESDHSYAKIPYEENNEAPEPGGERKSVDKTYLTLNQSTFLILNKSLPYEEFREQNIQENTTTS